MKGTMPHALRAIAIAIVAAIVYLSSPAEPRAQAAIDPKCNLYNQGKVCKEQQACAGFVFFKQCTTQYWRLIPAAGSGGAPEDDTEPTPTKN